MTENSAPLATRDDTAGNSGEGTERVPAEVFHIGEYIMDECAARGWTLDELAFRMGGRFGVTRLALDFLIEVPSKHVILGDQAAGLARAFGTSERMWQNIHDAWLRYAPEPEFDRESRPRAT